MSSVLERRSGESELDYHRRLLFAKLVDRSIDLSYSTLSKYLYGKQYAEDVARRMAYGSVRTLKLFDNEQVRRMVDKDAVDEIERQTAELARERQRFYDQRREYKKLHSLDGRIEHLYERLEKAADNLNETVGNMYADAERQYRPDEYFESDNEAVLVLSDWHYGMICNNVFNVYNTAICMDRVQKVIDDTVKRLRLHSVRKLHVVVLGDMIHGAIHASARVASEELVCDQLMEASEILAQSIAYLSQCVDEVEVHITYGNHARTVQNKNDNIHRDNMERIIPWWLEQRFKDVSSVKIAGDTGTEFLFVNACGHDICAAHGDLDMLRASTKTLPTLFHKQFGKDVEYIIVGDKHHRESFSELGITAMICGALCGTDDYANDKRLFSTPEQLLLIVNEKDGVDAEYHLKCDRE